MYSEQPEDSPSNSTPGSKPRIPRRILELVEELGFRFKPASAAAQADFPRMMQLLAQDISGMPTDLVERAVRHWIMGSAYMPKAADIRRLVDNFAAAGTDGQRKRLDQATPANETLDRDNPSFGYRWIQSEKECALHPVAMLQKVDGRWRFKASAPRVTAEQIDEIMAEFKIPSSSILGQIAGKVRAPLRAPTEADIADLKREMGITPQAEAAE